MSYSGASHARIAREQLGTALAALQEDPNIPPDVLAVAQNIAQAVGALFEAERATSEPDGKVCVRNAIGVLSQTLALLQDVRQEHRGITVATEAIARVMSGLYPLTTVPSRMPPPVAQAVAPPQPAFSAPAAKLAPALQPAAPAPAFSPRPASVPPAAPPATGPQQHVEVNIGATTESNFYVGFSGEIAEGGVFCSTYDVYPRGTPIDLLVTLPGGFDFRARGWVRFVRDPLDMAADSEPGMGVQFDGLDAQARALVLRFIAKRPPIFYDE